MAGRSQLVIARRPFWLLAHTPAIITRFTLIVNLPSPPILFQPVLHPLVM